MCQLSNKKINTVMLLTEPMTVWKLIEVDTDNIDGNDMRSYYQQMFIKMGETYVKCQNDKFIETVNAKVGSKYMDFKTGSRNFFELGEEGYHSFIDLGDVAHVMGFSRSYKHRLGSKWKAKIVKCEIPAGACYVEGVFYDMMHIRTVVSNAIRYVEILDSITLDTEAKSSEDLFKPS